MWKWSQSAAELSRNGAFVSRGYSGRGTGLNSPSMQAAVGVGPIPRGRWKLVSVATSPNTGPFTITLHAVDATPNDDREDGTGRSAFRIHGDSIKDPGNSSHGCVILPRYIRQKMWDSGDHDMEVVS